MGRGIILLTISLVLVTWTQSQKTSQGGEGGAQCSQLQVMMAEDLSLDQQTADLSQQNVELSRETADISKQTLEAVNKLCPGQGSSNPSVCQARMVFSDHNNVGYDLSASSTYNPTDFQPASSNGRSGWLKNANDNSPWIQVNMRVSNKVLGVITQGRGAYTQFVQTFFISYSSDFINWTNYTLENVKDTATKIFEGNKSDKDTKINMFQTPFTAKALRLHPVECSGHCALRWDVYSCTV